MLHNQYDRQFREVVSFSQSIKVDLLADVLVGAGGDSRNDVVVISRPEELVLHRRAEVDRGVKNRGNLRVEHPVRRARQWRDGVHLEQANAQRNNMNQCSSSV